MAAFTPAELSIYCALFDYFAEIDGDRKLAHIYFVLPNKDVYHWNTVSLI